MPPKKAPSKKVPAKKAAKKAPAKGPTVKELREKAKAQKIKGYSSMKKDELIKALGKRPKSPSPTKREKSPAKKYKWQWKVGDIINYPQLITSGGYPTIQGKWMDFNKDNSKRLDIAYGYWIDPNVNILPPAHIDNVQPNFKAMTMAWIFKLPIGGSIEITDSIRRVEKLKN